MRTLLAVELASFETLSHELSGAIANPPTTSLAVEPLERSLYKLGITMGITLSLNAISEYRSRLCLAIMEEIGA